MACTSVIDLATPLRRQSLFLFGRAKTGKSTPLHEVHLLIEGNKRTGSS